MDTPENIYPNCCTRCYAEIGSTLVGSLEYIHQHALEIDGWAALESIIQSTERITRNCQENHA